MIKLNIHEAKTHLSEYLAKLGQGQTIVLCKRNRPTAEIRPIPALPDAPRSVDLAKDIFELPATFFEPLRHRDPEGARWIPDRNCRRAPPAGSMPRSERGIGGPVL